MKNFYSYILLAISIICILSLSMDADGGNDKNKGNGNIINWKQLDKGLFYSEVNAPQTSIASDSKLCILKISPEYYEFGLYSSSQYHSKPMKANKWAERFHLTAVINAGMFNLKDFSKSTGYMQNFKHLNNPDVRSDYGAMIAFNPINKKNSSFEILDIKCHPWDSVKNKYNSFVQNIRMIDCNKQPVYWKKKTEMISSMVVIAKDTLGNALFVFSRSPYNANQITDMLLALPLGVQSAAYLEGGPEASLFVNTKSSIITKMGSWVSKTFENDNNKRFWALPNVIGIKKKQVSKTKLHRGKRS